MALKKIVSGGQTGIDRGALDAALEARFPCGGWAPAGRLSEDGLIPERYPLAELVGASYEERTLRNVLDSDGTAILYLGELEGGTRLTAQYCQQHRNPCELLNADRMDPDEAAREIVAFIAGNRIAALNVAGPRASKWPGARDYAFSAIELVLIAFVSARGRP